ncbi:MAG TPA: BPSS1780 family membrane protein [Gallionella sp.]|jgi:uncharacterized membrane protein
MEPLRLEANQGWQWIKKGYALFMQAPLLWIVLLAICFVAAAGISAVPVIGEPLVSLLMPVVVIGLMAGCRSLELGDELELAHLFSGFQRHTSHLITLGGIALVSQYLIFGVMMMVGGATLVGIMMNNHSPAAPEVIQQAVAGAGAAVMIGITLFSVLLMSMQFAPMLVFFHNIAPVAAMKLSLRAFTRNVGAMFVYGMAFLLLAILASIPMMLGWLVLMPIVFTSLYASFCDIFPAEVSSAPIEGEVITRDDQAHF